MAASSTTRKTPGGKAHSRARLIDAAAELFGEVGYNATTLDSVADRAGLHVQTLYRHFPSKPDLATGLWQRSLETFETFFRERDGDAIGAWRDWVELNARRMSARRHRATDMDVPA